MVVLLLNFNEVTVSILSHALVNAGRFCFQVRQCQKYKTGEMKLLCSAFLCCGKPCLEQCLLLPLRTGEGTKGIHTTGNVSAVSVV